MSSEAPLDITEVCIHRATLGAYVALNGRWCTLADHAELAAVAAELTDIADKLRAMHEEEMNREH